MIKLSKGKRAANRRGFSLTEFMVGMSLVGILLAGAVSTITVGYRAFSSAKDNQQAVQILKHETEKLRLLSWESLTSEGKEVKYGVDERFTGEDFQRFSIKRTLVERRPVQYQVEIKVVWEDVFGRAKHQKTTTFVTRNGLNASYGAF